MIIRLLSHARSNAIAYAALVLSTLGLAGGAYAALAVPPNSVGALQLRNHAIAPIKLDPHGIGGSIRHWAQVDAQGHILASSSRAHQTGIPPIGHYIINWSDRFSSHCVVLATPRATLTSLGPSTGYADTLILPPSHPTFVWVKTYNPQGQAAPMAFAVAVIC
jgi:hypothetical protein